MLTREIPSACRGGVHLPIPPTAIGSVPSLSGHAFAYRWRSLPRVRPHRANSIYICMVITYSKGKDQPGEVANPARGQLNRENVFFPVSVRSRLSIWCRKTGLVVPVPRQPAHIHTQAESGAYLRDSSQVPQLRLFIYLLFKSPYVIEVVPSLSGDASTYRWRPLPRVRRHRASKPQGNSTRMLPW